MRSWMALALAACVLVGFLSGCVGPGEPSGTPPAPASAAPAPHDLSLTIYSNADPAEFDPQRYIAQERQGTPEQTAWGVPGFGVVRDARTFGFAEGQNRIAFADVAQFIDPTTVNLRDLSVPEAAPAGAGIQVIEQKFQFDLVSPSKLMDKYLDRRITVNQNAGDGRREAVTGTLLSVAEGKAVLRTERGVRILSADADVQLGDLPQGLITRPTLNWLVHAPAAGPRNIETSYQTDGITWRADYSLLMNADDTQADLAAWVTVLNLSGARYENAGLKLIAGQVRRVKPDAAGASFDLNASLGGGGAAPATFQEKPFFEYHLYTLPRRTTIENNSTQQLALFPTVQDIKVEKVLVYYGTPGFQDVFPEPRNDSSLRPQGNHKLDVYVRLDNREANKLGMPLPRGKVRVYKADTAAPSGAGATARPAGDGAHEFVGEDLIDHTARNEKVMVKIGQAFDLTGERVQTDFQFDEGTRHRIEEAIRITVRNAKPTPQKVIIRENLYRWLNWDIIKKSDPFEKIDSRTIHFDVTVPAEGEKTVEYTVKYTW